MLLNLGLGTIIEIIILCGAESEVYSQTNVGISSPKVNFIGFNIISEEPLVELCVRLVITKT